ncbi:hypothetical protein Pla100_55960 [Neorhodopirellula pilleata]|uniref:Uncharacterized protein n=2 Tax=Neorhodopirellula pilleata TaxID=2714738 RepID=A0A5C5ZP87_9BACT|nr:hypothetical protein Pla100_55960 [Neorhodopirellula pilleata]
MGLGNTRDFGRFIASAGSSFNYGLRTEQWCVDKISRITPNEIVRGHIFYSPAIENALVSNRCISLFIYRDPREVARSLVNYLQKMNRFHRLRAYFKGLDPEAALLLAINGIPSCENIYFPSISERFRNYQGWLASEAVYCTKFEDVAGENQEQELRKIIRFYLHRSGSGEQTEDILKRMRGGLQPAKSHTFSGIQQQTWRDAFTPACIKAFKEQDHGLLTELGYEFSEDWS